MGEEVKGGREEGRGGKNNGFLPPQSGKSSKSCVLVILERKKQGEQVSRVSLHEFQPLSMTQGRGRYE
ncbi:unnamed protein product [Prunus armeniaca]